MEFQYHILNKIAVKSLADKLSMLINSNEKPVFICIGSDLAIGDSLGPICGSILKSSLTDYFIYGCLKKPVTAREIQYINKFIKKLHPNSLIIAIDAAVGKQNDIGLIKLLDCGIFPGSGVNKKLDIVGDISIMGIVAEKSPYNYSILHATRLNLVYTMATIITNAILLYTKTVKESSKTIEYFKNSFNNRLSLPTNPQ